MHTEHLFRAFFFLVGAATLIIVTPSRAMLPATILAFGWLVTGFRALMKFFYPLIEFVSISGFKVSEIFDIAGPRTAWFSTPTIVIRGIWLAIRTLCFINPVPIALAGLADINTA
jgi:hypothetical protein